MSLIHTISTRRIWVCLFSFATVTAISACKPKGLYELTPANTLDPVLYGTEAPAGYSRAALVSYVGEEKIQDLVPTSGPEQHGLYRIEAAGDVFYAVDGILGSSGQNRKQNLINYYQANNVPVEAEMLGYATVETNHANAIPIYALVDQSQLNWINHLTTSEEEKSNLVLNSNWIPDVKEGSVDGIIGYAEYPPLKLICPDHGSGQDCALAKGLVINIHGGGFQDDSNGSAPPLSATSSGPTYLGLEEQRWLARDWAVASLSYRSSREEVTQEYKDFLDYMATVEANCEGASPEPVVYPDSVPGSAHFSFQDVQFFYDHREEIISAIKVAEQGPQVGSMLASLPTCAVGYSAGATLALALAANNHQIDCVVADAGPTNFIDEPNAQNMLGEFTRTIGEVAFGLPGQTPHGGYTAAEFNPYAMIYGSSQRILLGDLSTDPLIGLGHIASFENEQADGFQQDRFESFTLTGHTGVPGCDDPLDPPTDTRFFVHGYAVEADYDAYRLLEDQMVHLVEQGL